jgi:hypothetical protein
MKPRNEKTYWFHVFGTKTSKYKEKILTEPKVNGSKRRKIFQFHVPGIKTSKYKEDIRKPQFLGMIGPKTNGIQEMKNLLISSDWHRNSKYKEKS